MPNTSVSNLDYLHPLIANAPFLRVTSSREAYPDHPGDGMPLLEVETSKCQALIAFQGAHLVSFLPKNGEDFLWLSPNCDFTAGKALRGGIPLCMPWFGPDKRNPNNPKHGFARNQDWQLTQASLDSDGNAILHFGFDSPANAMFEWSFTAELVMTLGDTLALELRATNLSKTAMPFSFALHSYHPVASLETAAVLGLAGRTYLDNLDSNAAKQQHGNVTFMQEVDRYFLGVKNFIEIQGCPRLKLEHSNCPSVITWNPGAENAAKITDIGAGNHEGYICAERGAVLDESWEIAPQETQTASILLSRI